MVHAMASAYLVAPRVVDDYCHACGTCLARQACRPRAILIEEPGETPFIDASRCYGCRACVAACPFGAVAVAVAA